MIEASMDYYDFHATGDQRQTFLFWCSHLIKKINSFFKDKSESLDSSA
jgi:hypothetical protein